MQKHSLYIPVALHLPSERLKIGDASPIDLFLARLWQPAANSYLALYERIKSYAGKSLLDFLEAVGKSHFMTYSIHQEIVHDFPRGTEVDFLPVLHFPTQVLVSGRPLWMTSFSTLSQRLEHKANEQLAILANAPHDHESAIKNVHTLPSHYETGLLIHHILEKLTFRDFKYLKHEEEAAALVRPFVQKTAFKEWELVIGHLIFHTLRTPLSVDFRSFLFGRSAADRSLSRNALCFSLSKGRGYSRSRI